MTGAKKSDDLNDKLLAGALPPDPFSGATPTNVRARRRVEQQPSIQTVRRVLAGIADEMLGERSNVDACTTGITELDAVTGGLRGGHVWVLGASTSWGKSSFAVAVADVNIQLGRRVLIVSVEDDPRLYGRRLIARRANVNAVGLRDGTLSRDELARVVDVIQKAEELPFVWFAVDQPAEKIAEHLEWAIEEHQIDLVILDYLHEFRGSGRFENRRDEVSRVAAALRGAIKAKQASGLILAQITQDPKDPPDRLPSRLSIRDSRDVCNAAEVVVLGFTPKRSLRDLEMFEGRRYLLVDKNKDGPNGAIVDLEWDPLSASFRFGRAR
jgi:replicative DNA helicase